MKILLLLFIVDRLSAQTLTPNQTYMIGCRKDFGMQSYDIPDSAITASSSYDDKSVGPSNARIRTERNGGAWCPKSLISRNVSEWLQVDLGALKVISLVETQGRFGNGQGQEYTPQYMLEYQRQEEGQWIRYKDHKGNEVINGNINTYIAELRELHPVIIARKVRFIPYSNHPRTVCVRVELYGCDWADGVISYEMRQGDKRGGAGELDFSDFTYDGHVNNGYLSGGLGQLTDLEEGSTQFRLDLQFVGKRGFEWIAWKNDNPSADPVDIIFRFDQVRNFSALRVHANNLFSKEIAVFRLARISFSVGGHFYNEQSVDFEPTIDLTNEQARYISIPIAHRIGRYIKVALFFQSRWIMISEVRFTSEVLTNETFEEESAPLPKTAILSSPNTTAAILLTSRTTSHTRHVTSDQSQTSTVSPRSGLSVISVDLENNENNVPSDTPPVALNEKDSLVCILLATFGALFVISSIAVFILAVRYCRRKYHASPLKSMFVEDHVNFDLNYLSQGGKLSNGNIYSLIASTDSTDSGGTVKDGGGAGVVGGGKPPAVFSCRMNGLFHVDGKSCCGSGVGGEDGRSRQSSELSSMNDCRAENCSNVASEARNLTSNRATSFGRNAFWPPASVESHPDLNASGEITEIADRSFSLAHPGAAAAAPTLYNFPPEKLRFIKKFSDGTFGEVHICDTTDLPQKLFSRFQSSLCRHQTNNRAVRVAIRMLRKHATEAERLEFEKEIRLISSFTDLNLVQTLGVCRTGQLSAIVVEFTALGSLRQFLSSSTSPEHNVGGGHVVKNTNYADISHSCLVHIATQIASGMKYLESLNLIHRDLASRNCLIGHQFIVKICDFGIGRYLYPSDYHVLQSGVALPLRWMSWESILMETYSCKSDVWSFGVTLWEIFTLARIRPYDELSDEQVVDNVGHCSRGAALGRSLAKPAGCPKEIYDLMTECWSRDECRRPAFREIHMFLSRKSLGYNPYIEQPDCCSRSEYADYIHGLD